MVPRTASPTSAPSPDHPVSDPVRPWVVRAGAVLLLVLTSTCGTASRTSLALAELSGAAREPGGLERLRGREAALPLLWGESARQLLVQARQDALSGVDPDPRAPEKALALVDQGLALHPSDTGLLSARVELLTLGGQPDLALEAIQRLLTAPVPAPARAQLERQALGARLDLQLLTGDLDGAQATAERLGGRLDADPYQQAGSFARLALAQEQAGDRDRADRLLDRALSLAATPALQILGLIGLQRPELAPAGRALRARALERPPRRPALQLAVAMDQLETGDLDGCQASLARLPDGLPRQLVPDREALAARLAIRQGDLDGGLARLLARLDERPLDGPALMALQETWRLHGRPDDATLAERLWRARRALPADAYQDRAELDALLDQLEPAGPPAPDGG